MLRWENISASCPLEYNKGPPALPWEVPEPLLMWQWGDVFWSVSYRTCADSCPLHSPCVASWVGFKAFRTPCLSFASGWRGERKHLGVTDLLCPEIPPVTWGDIKSLVASAQQLTQQKHQEETPEIPLILTVPQLTWNLLLLVCCLLPFFIGKVGQWEGET